MPNNILQEIRKQPEHVRHIFMWLCVVISFSLVGFVWFRSTQEKFVAMLHPEEVQQIKNNLAEAKQDQDSLFSGMSRSFSLLRASIVEVFNAGETDFNGKAEEEMDNEVRFFPVSGNK